MCGSIQRPTGGPPPAAPSWRAGAASKSATALRTAASTSGGAAPAAAPHRRTNRRPTVARMPPHLQRNACLVEQVGLLAGDPVPQRLEAEPAHHRVPDLLAREARRLVGDGDRLARRLGAQLRLAGALHGDEPPGRL